MSQWHDFQSLSNNGLRIVLPILRLAQRILNSLQLIALMSVHRSVVVVAADNSNCLFCNFNPSNCPGVITVGASTKWGSSRPEPELTRGRCWHAVPHHRHEPLRPQQLAPGGEEHGHQLFHPPRGGRGAWTVGAPASPSPTQWAWGSLNSLLLIALMSVYSGESSVPLR